jgi:hypothetical protein
LVAKPRGMAMAPRPTMRRNPPNAQKGATRSRIEIWPSVRVIRSDPPVAFV